MYKFKCYLSIFHKKANKSSDSETLVKSDSNKSGGLRQGIKGNYSNFCIFPFTNFA